MITPKGIDLLSFFLWVFYTVIISINQILISQSSHYKVIFLKNLLLIAFNLGIPQHIFINIPILKTTNCCPDWLKIVSETFSLQIQTPDQRYTHNFYQLTIPTNFILFMFLFIFNNHCYPLLLHLVCKWFAVLIGFELSEDWNWAWPNQRISS